MLRAKRADARPAIDDRLADRGILGGHRPAAHPRLRIDGRDGKGGDLSRYVYAIAGRRRLRGQEAQSERGASKKGEGANHGGTSVSQKRRQRLENTFTTLVSKGK